MRTGWANGLAIGFLSALAGSVGATAFDLEELLAHVALEDRREVSYVESRFIGAVAEPIVVRGRFIYEPPDRLIKLIDEPHREKAILDRDRLTIYDADDAEIASIDLWLQPDLRLVFDSVRGVLIGDTEALRDAFWISLGGNEEGWELGLIPKTHATQTDLDRIIVSGHLDAVSVFEIRETDGDRSVIRIMPKLPDS